MAASDYELPGDETLMYDAQVRRILHDDRYYGLPHPRRAELLKQNDALFEVCAATGVPLREILGEASLPMHEAGTRLDAYPGFRELLGLSREIGQDVHLGTLKAQLIAARHALLAAPLLQTTDVLEQMLEATQLPDDIPAYMLRLPYQCCFIEFGTSRRSRHRILNKISGEHILEGVYATEDAFRPKGGVNVPVWLAPQAQTQESVRSLTLCLTGSPAGKKQLDDDAHHVITLYILDEGECLGEIFERSVVGADSVGGAKKLGGPEVVALRESIWHAVAVLLYLNLSDVRQVAKQELTQAIAEMQRLGPKKRAKAERRLGRLYDRVEIGPQRLPGDLDRGASDRADSEAARTVRPHWRRGHFRHQRYGTGRAQAYLRYIAPSLVAGRRESDESPPPRDYTIR